MWQDTNLFFTRVEGEKMVKDSLPETFALFSVPKPSSFPCNRLIVV
jgi:hypothetical protein